ncbi:MAG: formate--tetrahydrofolate ligase, partial [Lactobacillaceae bacterium]
VNGVVREDQFEITAASELMAILCLSKDYHDLKERIGKILIGYTYDQKPVQVADLGFAGPIAAIMAKALKPNLVQTLEHNPVFVHGGPFANIAHGANSILATKLALNYGDCAITEAGFGSDLGAEKFIDLVSQSLGIMPKVIVIVSSIRSLKFQTQGSMEKISDENVLDVKKGYANLKQHIQNLQTTGIKVIVAINQFSSDTSSEKDTLTKLLNEDGFSWAFCQTFEKGSEGGFQLAELVHQALEQKAVKVQPFYQMSDDLKTKINKVAIKVYHASKVVYSAQAEKSIQDLKIHRWDNLPICIAKTPQSFTDDPQILGAPRNFTLHIRDIKPKLGAGFIVVYTGKILTMPGLPNLPQALAIDLDDEGTILGPV